MNKQNQGYTLTELLVSLGIFTVVIGSLLSVLISQNNFFGQATGGMEVSQAASKTMNLMVKELRTSKVDLAFVYDRPLDQSGAILNHINGVSIVFQAPVDWDGDSDTFDEFGRIEWGADGNLDWSIEYYRDSENERVRRRTWDAGGVESTDVIIAENISAFLIQGFVYNTGSGSYELDSACDIVEITVTAQKTAIGGRALAVPLTYTLSNRVKWRN